MHRLHKVTALVEIPTGLGLIAVPAVVGRLGCWGVSEQKTGLSKN